MNILMIVAHPDDETLFGYDYIYKNNSIIIICLTNEDNYIRHNEFINVIKFNKCSRGIILNNIDTPHDKTHKFELDIEKLNINMNLIDLIVSHGPDGEYGHIQHIAAHNLSKILADKYNKQFMYFERKKISKKMYYKRKKTLLFYKSQKKSIDKHYKFLFK